MITITHTPAQAARQIEAWFSRPDVTISMDNMRQVCRYRGEDGGKCALGVLIDDEQYTPTIEYADLTKLLLRGEIQFTHAATIATVSALQHAHDSTKDVDKVCRLARQLMHSADEEDSDA